MIRLPLKYTEETLKRKELANYARGEYKNMPLIELLARLDSKETVDFAAQEVALRMRCALLISNDFCYADESEQLHHVQGCLEDGYV